MSYTYAKRRHADNASHASQKTRSSSHISMDALRSSMAKPTTAQLGHRVNLPDAMRAKMENAFGADLSAVKLYESQAVGDAGAEAITQGRNIAFAPGKLDLSSRGGQALLGHELSHVVSQARGEVRGSGFLNNSALEARADREGEMAAAGETVYSGPITTALSTASAASAAGPMQAKKDKKQQEQAAQQAQAPQAQPAPQPAPQAQEEEEDENGFLGDALDAGISATDNLNDQFEELEDGKSNVLGKTLDKLKVSKETREKLSEASDMSNGSMGTLKSILDVGQGYEDLQAARREGSQSGAVNAKLDIGKSYFDTTSNGSSLGSSIAKKLGKEGLSKKLSNFSDYAGIGSDGVDLLKNAYNLHESSVRKQNMSKSLHALEQKENLTANDQRMLQIFRQGKRNARVDQIDAGFQTTSSTLGLGSKLAGSATPAGTVLSAGKKAVDFVGDAVTDYERDQFHDKTVEEELDTKGTHQSFQNSDRYKAVHGLDEKTIRRAALRRAGYASGRVDEAFQGITDKRADDVMSLASQGDENAKEYAKNAGVDLTAADAKTGIRKSLGVDEMQEFHDSDQLKYNAFAKGAQANEEASKRTNWEGIKYYAGKAGNFIASSVKTGAKKVASAAKGVGHTVVRAAKGVGRAATSAWSGLKKAGSGIKSFFTNADTRARAWAAVKTGAGKVASGVKNGIKSGAKSLWSGLKKAGSGIKSFLTDADTRARTWAAVKTGASKAVQGIKAGASKAVSAVGKGARYMGNVAKHKFNSVKDSIVDWYQNGVDQFNINQDTYKRMGLLSRAAWTMKNLPARLTASKQKGNTYRRYMRAREADRVLADMEEQKRKQAQQNA